MLADGVDASDPYAPIRALRGLKHEKLQKRLFLVDKEARMRSGARGLQARKALVAFEKVVADSQALYVDFTWFSIIPSWVLLITDI